MMFLRPLAVSLVFAAALAKVQAADWVRYRGPNLDNTSTEQGRINPWPANPGPRQLWRTSVGIGFSGISSSGNRLYTLGNAYTTDTIYCLDKATGGILWTNAYPASLAPILYEGGPSATPTVHNGVIYSIGKAGDLFCLNATNGAVIWEKKIIQDFGIKASEWGFASSPLIIGEKLILNAGTYGCALHKDTGELIWLSDTNRSGYATPIQFDADGTNALLVFAYREVAAVTLDEGKVLWKIPWQTQYDQNCSDPIPHKGSFFVSSATRASTMIRFQNGVLSTNWQNSQLNLYLSPGVVRSNHLYAFHGENGFKCIDLDNGQIKWSEPAMLVGSVICVGNRLLILTGNGELILAEPNPTAFTALVRTYVISGKCWTMPTFLEGNLYMRNAAGDLYAFELPWEPAIDPSLAIEAQPPDKVVISWPSAATGFQLQGRSTAEGASWGPIAPSPSVLGNRNVVTNQVLNPGKFYRLVK